MKILPSKREIEHWLFDQKPGHVDKTPFRKVSPNGLKRFLDLSGENHVAGYFQYTNVGALTGIFKNAALHLSLGRMMNDKVEFRTCDPKLWARTYLACFSFGTSENVGMWALYGRPPKTAVRIAFPKASMKSIRESANSSENIRIATKIRKNGGVFSYRPLPSGTVVEEVSLHDVVYQYGRERMSENGAVRQGTVLWNRRKGLASRCSTFSDLSNCPALATYFKDVDWANEFEVRLVVRLNRPLSSNKSIAIMFPRKALSGITVTLGPMTKNPDRTIARIGNRCPGLTVTDSAFRAVYR